MKNKGMLMDEAGDLRIRLVKNDQGMVVSGLTVGESTYQNQYIILTAQKGELKEFPVLGIGIADMVNDHDVSGWGNEIRMQLAKDGMKVNKVKFDRNKNLEIEATYGDD